jgi:alpha-tubulin suppressor-like RCC1 family protein
VPPLDFGTNRRVLQLSTSFYHSCVRFEDNKARCWGRNESGQLGNNTQLDYGDIGDQLSNLPDLPLSNVQSITAGRYNTCAVAGTAGFERLYCWGANAHGELGRSNTAVLHQPGEPAELNARPLASIAGNSWVCALLSNAARCWGTYSYGVQGTGPASSWLGDNEFPNLPSHNVKGLPVGAPTMLTGIANTMCALAGGDVYCWGRNQNGQTGYPVTPYGTEIWQPPRAVNLGDVSLVQISTGANANCGLDDEGFVRCWGYDVNDGSLGYPGISQIGADRDPAFDYQLMRGGDAGISDGIDAGPVTPGLPIGAVDLGDFDGMPGPDPATHVEVGPDRACAIMENGAVRCWGEDTAGLLGYGTGVSYIGLTDSPAQAYEKIGYADVKIFGPLPSDGGL